ncbi:MAG: hypothetical protein FWE40_06035 [Oscillospiraceae bacterium]|nr:hypothetical protein [Oscillospiraceae bacterium]
MKKVLALIAAIAMLFSLGIVLTACGGNNGENGYPEYPTEYNDNDDRAACCADECECPYYPYCEEDCDCANVDENENENDNDNDVLAADADPANDNDNDDPVDPLLPPANLHQLGRNEQIAFVNTALNRVRDEQPGFFRRQRLQMSDINLAGGVIVRNLGTPVVNFVVGMLMDGDWYERTFAPGSNLQTEFFADTARFDIRPADVANMTVTPAGNGGFTITVRAREEVNPAPRNSANGRMHQIMTRDEVLAEILDVSAAIRTDISEASLRYHGGHITFTVNAQGQITAANGGFNVAARTGQVNLGPVTVDYMTAAQVTEFHFTNFVWR